MTVISIPLYFTLIQSFNNITANFLTIIDNKKGKVFLIIFSNFIEVTVILTIILCVISEKF